jgi:hypothetical protein
MLRTGSELGQSGQLRVTARLMRGSKLTEHDRFFLQAERRNSRVFAEARYIHPLCGGILSWQGSRNYKSSITFMALALTPFITSTYHLHVAAEPNNQQNEDFRKVMARVAQNRLLNLLLVAWSYQIFQLRAQS